MNLLDTWNIELIEDAMNMLTPQERAVMEDFYSKGKPRGSACKNDPKVAKGEAYMRLFESGAKRMRDYFAGLGITTTDDLSFHEQARTTEGRLSQGTRTASYKTPANGGRKATCECGECLKCRKRISAATKRAQKKEKIIVRGTSVQPLHEGTFSVSR